jgi:hypothetical protein
MASLTDMIRAIGLPQEKPMSQLINPIPVPTHLTHGDIVPSTSSSPSGEVDLWFDERQLTPGLRALFPFCRTRADLSVLAESILADWPAAYKRYAVRYTRQSNGEELGEDEFAVFVRYLRELQPNITRSTTAQSKGVCTVL